MRSEDVTFRVLVNNKPVKEYEDDQGQLWIEGRKESNYKIRVKNLSPNRRLVVITVDGLSVMDGKKGSFDSPGYVLNGHEKIDIPGFRLDNTNIAKFRFGSLGDSYAASKGGKSNVGVIGCAVFNEVYQLPPIHINQPWQFTGGIVTCDSANIDLPAAESVDITFTGNTLSDSAGNTGNNFLGCVQNPRSQPRSIMKGLNSSNKPIKRRTQPVSQSIGTSFGKKEEFAVNSVTFERCATPAAVFNMRYDDRKGLKARGINMKPKPTAATPNPFPADLEQGCEPPKGWKNY